MNLTEYMVYDISVVENTTTSGGATILVQYLPTIIWQACLTRTMFPSQEMFHFILVLEQVFVYSIFNVLILKVSPLGIYSNWTESWINNMSIPYSNTATYSYLNYGGALINDVQFVCNHIKIFLPLLVIYISLVIKFNTQSLSSEQ